MPDLLGPNPCEGCAGSRREKCGFWKGDIECEARAAYAAKRELLEALKAGGLGMTGQSEWQVKCIPVEPERVKEDAFPQWHPPCGFQGLCHNGWGSKWCAECPWFDKAPSPGLLQRMGMATWPEEQWIVTSLDFGWYTTEEKAMEYVRQNPNKRRAFRWQDGVQG